MIFEYEDTHKKVDLGLMSTIDDDTDYIAIRDARTQRTVFSMQVEPMPGSCGIKVLCDVGAHGNQFTAKETMKVYSLITPHFTCDNLRIAKLLATDIQGGWLHKYCMWDNWYESNQWVVNPNSGNKICVFEKDLA